MEKFFNGPIATGSTTSSSCSTATTKRVSSLFVSRKLFLKRLKLEGCTNLNDKTVLKLISTCDPMSLQYLDLSFIGHVSTSTWIKLTKEFRNLVELRAQGHDEINRKVMNCLVATNQKQLKLLDIRHCAFVEDITIHPLLVCRQLEAFYLSFSGTKEQKITSIGLQSLPSKLKVLELASLQQIDDESCFFLARKFGATLERLNLSNCPQVTIAGLHVLLTNCPHLYELNVYGCPHVISFEKLIDPQKIKDFALDFIFDQISNVKIKFYGFKSFDFYAQKTIKRQFFLKQIAKRNQAAIFLQSKFRYRLENRKQKNFNFLQQQFLNDASISIQSVFRGYKKRCEFKKNHFLILKKTIFIQKKWRQKLLKKKAQRAILYWIHQMETKSFFTWKKKIEELKKRRQQLFKENQKIKAFIFWNQKQIRQIFFQWKEFMKNQKQIKTKILISWKFHFIPKILTVWQEITKKNKYLKKRIISEIFMNVINLEAQNSTRQIQQRVSYHT
jgi:hypothetical protein